jgi:2'-5' RNA ligase
MKYTPISLDRRTGPGSPAGPVAERPPYGIIETTMKTIRSFIAIDLSPEARAGLGDLQNRLKAVVPPKTVRWTALPNIHLTLHFLGEIAVNDVETVTGLVQATAANFQPFRLSLAGLGCFPNTRRPRIVWVGVGGGTRVLGELQRELGERLQVINFTPEARPYSPHLTIGRVNNLPPHRLAQLGELVEQEQLAVGELAQLTVAEIRLIKSDLQPAGPVYTSLARGILGTRHDLSTATPPAP